MASVQALITQLARKYGVDPRAALAIASVEGGFHGSVGDNGTSFGPFQLHEGGALPHGRGASWANSAAGINYAMRHIASVAHGLHGRQAVAAISSRFERPANVPAEIAKAMGRYGGVGGGGMQVPTGNGGRMAAGIGGGNSPDISSLLQMIQQRNAQAPMQQGLQMDPLVVRMALNQQLNPQAVRYGLNS